MSAKPVYAISSNNCHRNVSLPSGASLWDGMFGRVEGQYTTIFALIRGSCLDFFTISKYKELYPFCPCWFLQLIKSGCFAITRYSLRSSRGSKFLKPLPLHWVLNLVIFSTPFFIIRWSLQNSYGFSKVNILPLNNFVIFCSSAVVCVGLAEVDSISWCRTGALVVRTAWRLLGNWTQDRYQYYCCWSPLMHLLYVCCIAIFV